MVWRILKGPRIIWLKFEYKRVYHVKVQNFRGRKVVELYLGYMGKHTSYHIELWIIKMMGLNEANSEVKEIK